MGRVWRWVADRIVPADAVRVPSWDAEWRSIVAAFPRVLP